MLNLRISSIITCIFSVLTVAIASTESQSNAFNRQNRSPTPNNQYNNNNMNNNMNTNFNNNMNTNFNNNNNNNLNRQEPQFSGQSELPFLYRSLVQNSNPLENSNNNNNNNNDRLQNAQGSEPNKDSKPEDGGNQQQTATIKPSEFFWPQSIQSFSDKSSQNSNLSPSTEDNTVVPGQWRNFNNSGGSGATGNNGKNDKSQFFETPSGPTGSSSNSGAGNGSKTKGVAFWPRNFASGTTKQATSSSSKISNGQDQFVNWEKIERSNRDGGPTPASFQNGPENWKRVSTMSQIIDKSDVNNHEKSTFNAELQRKIITKEPKRALSPFSFREDFSTKSNNVTFKLPEVEKEPQPPIIVSDSFKLPVSKPSGYSRFRHRSSPIVPMIDMIDMATGNDAKSAKIMARLTGGRSFAPVQPEMSASDHHNRRWGQDVADRIKEFKQNRLNKQKLSQQDQQNAQKSPQHGQFSIFKSTSEKPSVLKSNKADEIKATTKQPWSGMSFNKRRFQLSKRLVELMSKNRVSRRARLFGGFMKNEKPEANVRTEILI